MLCWGLCVFIETLLFVFKHYEVLKRVLFFESCHLTYCRALGDKKKKAQESRKERERLISITSFNPLLCPLIFKNSHALGLWDEVIGWGEPVMCPIVFYTNHMSLSLSLFSSVCTAVTSTPPSSPPSTAGATGSYR